MTELLKNARRAINQTQDPEVTLIQDNEAVRDFWLNRQALVAEMNTAISEAVKEIRQRYQDRLDDLDNDYAMYLQMITPAEKNSQ